MSTVTHSFITATVAGLFAYVWATPNRYPLACVVNTVALMLSFLITLHALLAERQK